MNDSGLKINGSGVTQREDEADDTVPADDTNRSLLVTMLRIPKMAWMGILLLGIVGLGLSYLASLREIGGYGVETDFYGSFVPEARRLVAGQSLEIVWQPPLYSILLSAVYALVGDWFQAGLIISVCSGVIALAAAYWLFGSLLGWSFGIAAALSLMIWPDFVVYSVTASADMMFVGLMFLGLAIASASSESLVFRGVLAGVIAGLASLTRTNGFVLLLLPLFYASQYSRGRRLGAALSASCGFLLPWGMWVLTSAITKSPLFPSSTYIDIAVAFFGPEGHRNSSNSDNWEYAASTFTSLADVLTHDPATLARGVVYNSMSYGWGLFHAVSPVLPAIAAIAAGSFIYLLAVKRLPALWVLFLILAAGYGVLCLRSFGSRYFLFLIPAVGVGVFGALDLASRRFLLLNRAKQPIAVLLAVVFSLAMGRIAARELPRLRNEGRDSLAAASVIQMRGITGRIVARKPHLGFHTGLEFVGFPPVATLGELKTQLCVRSGQGRTSLFYGEAEAALRRELNILQSPESAPDWLLPIGHERSELSKWTLYEVRCPPTSPVL